MRKIIICITASFCIGAIVYSQDKKIKKAEDNFNKYAFVSAIDSYEDLVKEGYTDEQIFKNLGNANYLNANYKVAAEWYGKLFQLDGANIDAEYMYRYAQTLKSMKKYEESDQWMQKFEAAKKDDVRAFKFSENSDYLEDIKERSGRYTIKNLSINSDESDFAPSFNGENLVFSSARDTGIVSRNIHEWNEKPFLNLYRAAPSEDGGFSNASKLPKNLNKKTHESSTVFTKDGTTVYFTRNNSDNGNFARDAEGVSRLKIYRAKLNNGEWTNITELPFNGDAHSAAHPALSPDETKLYFASDMEGTLGQSDIFVVDINSDGSFGMPKNLGNEINTEARETFPFVTASNVLYFASDGHPGLGGLDIFATKIDDLDNLFIVNPGEPVNSEKDDFSFIIDESIKKGFFASNRDGGQGSDDIYSFIEILPIQLDCTLLVTGEVKDRNTEAPIAQARLQIIDGQGSTIATAVSEDDGSFTINVHCKEGMYTVTAFKEAYEDGEKVVEVTNNAVSKIEVLLSPVRKAAAVGEDLTKVLNLKPIYFDLNKSVIRKDAMVELDKVLEYMNTYSEIKISVRSHTDSRGKDSYNQSLSDKRAKSTVAYLISKGINPTRITGQGYGESQLVNQCRNGVKCSKEEHELNRRSEFIVVE